MKVEAIQNLDLSDEPSMDNLICILKLQTQRINKDNYKTKYEAISYNGLKKDNPMLLVKYFESLITYE